MRGFHYSSTNLVAGDRIISNQDSGLTYALVWSIYNDVAKSMGLRLPETFGYAYPIEHEHIGMPKHIVQAPDDTVVYGVSYWSLFVTMGMLREFTAQSRTVAERISKRDAGIRKNAERYFKIDGVPFNQLEMISDCWIVQSA